MSTMMFECFDFLNKFNNIQLTLGMHIKADKVNAPTRAISAR